MSLLLQIAGNTEIIPIPRDHPNLYEYWMLPVFLIVLGLIAYIRVNYGKRLQRLFSSVVRVQILRQVMREELVFSHRASVLLMLNFVLISSLIIYAANKYYNWGWAYSDGLSFYLTIVALITGIYFLKLLLGQILRALFKDPGLIREYLFEVFLINKVAGILLLPLALAIIFVNVGKLTGLFLVAAAIVLLLVLFRTVQGLVMGLSYPVSRVYIILYLCTLEILPLLVVLKAFRTEIA